MKLQPKKSLGQHFLNSPHVLDQIISAARIQEGENVLEIGPGTGVLTTALLEAGANVIAVEKDDRAYELLREKFSKEIAAEPLRLIHGDILDPKIFDSQSAPTPYTLHASAGTPNWAPTSYLIVANIPYYITGAILEKFLEHEPRPDRMVLLVQKEVAERIVARPPHGKESILSISVKAFGTPKIIAKVPRGAFTPPPTVDSAILAIENISGTNFQPGAHFQGNYSQDNEIEGPDGADGAQIRRFFEIVRSGFAHKRKFLIRNLETIAAKEKLQSVWKKIDLNEKVRAEDLAVEDWLNLAAEFRDTIIL